MVSNKASGVDVIVHVGQASSARVFFAVELGGHQKFEDVDSVLEDGENDVDDHSGPGGEIIPEKEFWGDMRL